MNTYKQSSPMPWLIGGIAVVIALLVGLNFYNKKAVNSMTSREVALTCTTDMATQFHIHPVIEIYMNGEKHEIPANVGITPACMYSLHTHDASGTIHVESPLQKDFTLSDFFAVWNRPFSKDHILDHKSDDTHQVTMTVNGTESNEFENLILRDKDIIVIRYQTK